MQISKRIKLVLFGITPNFHIRVFSGFLEQALASVSRQVGRYSVIVYVQKKILPSGRI